MRKDLIFGMSVEESVAAGTTSGAGNAVDTLRKYAAKHVITCDAFTSTIVVKLQESDASGSGYTDVADADMIGGSNGITFAAANETFQIAGANLKRYQRVNIDSGAGTISGSAETADNLGS